VKQVLEAENVLAVVFEGAFEVAGPPTAQEFEVALGDQFARDVLLALEAEEAFLDGLQGAAADARPEQGAAQVEEVEVRAHGEFAGHAVESPPGAQQRKVEGGAVVGGDAGGQPKFRVQGEEEGRFVAGFGQEELDEFDPFGMGPCDGDGERIGPRPTRETGRLGVDEAIAVRVDSSQEVVRRTDSETADREHFGPSPGESKGCFVSLETRRQPAAPRVRPRRRPGVAA